MPERIDVSPDLNFTVENVSHGIRFMVIERGAQFGWTLSPLAVSKLTEAFTDALTMRKLQRPGSSAGKVNE